jgi:hypothetical protein
LPVTGSSRRPNGSDERDAERDVDDQPDAEPGNAHARQHGDVAVVRSAERVVRGGLESIVVREVDAEALAGPETISEDRVVDDRTPPRQAELRCGGADRGRKTLNVLDPPFQGHGRHSGGVGGQ